MKFALTTAADTKPGTCTICKRTGKNCRLVTSRTGIITGCYSNEYFFTEDTSQRIHMTPSPWDLWLNSSKEHADLIAARDRAQTEAQQAEANWHATIEALATHNLQPTRNTSIPLRHRSTATRAQADKLQAAEERAVEELDQANRRLLLAKERLHQFLNDSRFTFYAQHG